MDPSFSTPRDLVLGLHARQLHARKRLHHLLEEPIQRLMRELIAQHQLQIDHELVVLHALHLAEVILRVRPPDKVARMSWPVFRASLLLELGKLALEPFGGIPMNGVTGPFPLPDSPTYYSETFFRPSGRVGNLFFGGDWYAGHRLDDGSLWVFVADVTGHGYYAYLLATALPEVWQRLWSAHQNTAPEPAQVLASLHELLADCLPEGIFLECTLLRLTESGQATIAPAGGTRVLFHSVRRSPDLIQLRGAWIGLRAPHLDEQYHLQLGHGDEIVLATDGVFDQLDDLGGAEVISQRVRTRLGTLFASLCAALEQAVAQGEQKDDITMVLLRRRPATFDIEVLPFPGDQDQGHVSV